MSDDKSKNKTGDASGDNTGTPPTDGNGTSTSIPFGELWGQIDSRIEGAVRKVMGKGGDGASSASGETGTGSQADVQSVADQVRAELAKLNGEKEAADKAAQQEVTIQELKDQVAKITEGAPEQPVSRLTELMWGKRKKS